VVVTKSFSSDPGWQKLISEYLWLGAILDDETEMTTTSCIAVAQQVSSNDAYLSRKVRHYSSTFMMEFVDITLHQGECSIKPFGKVFTGR
jgi:hypothetical protein